MRQQAWVNLGLALGVLALTWLVFFKSATVENADGYKLSTLNAAQIDQINIAAANRPRIVLRKNQNTWFIAEPFHARADPVRVESLLGVLSAQSEKRFSTQDLARYALDKPLVQLQLGAQTFAFGGVQALSNQLYVLTRGAVYLISPVYFVDMTKPATDFISKQLLDAQEIPIAFEFPHYTLIRQNGTWRMTPQTARFTQDSANILADEWSHAQANAITQSPNFKTTERITLRFASGKSLVLLAAQQGQEWVVLRQDTQLAYHFTLDAAQHLRDPWLSLKK